MIRARHCATCCSAHQVRALPPRALQQRQAAPRRTWAWCRRAGASCADRAHRRRCRLGSPKRTSTSTPGEFKRTGFRGPLNYYRNLDRNWEIQAALSGAQVTVPALYIAGDRDFVVSSPGMDQLIANLKHFVPGLRKVQMLPGCGHWTQQERAVEVNAALLEFLRGLPA